ncbi:MAG: SDR family oxidoreductase [Streptococcaceae bacterium]|nr:SDR family oxidoreductase [Streptococcaceae bacterium]
MDLQLVGKTALITGSTKGIGRKIAECLASEGVRIIINGRNQEEVAQVAQTIADRYLVETVAAPFDLANPKERMDLFALAPDIDILVNNAAIFEEKPIFKLLGTDLMRYLQVNSLAAAALSQFYLPKLLKKNKDGRIIFIASEAAIQPPKDMAHYAATKAYNLSFAKSLAMETKGSSVTVNTVMPGPTYTEGIAEMLHNVLPDVHENLRESTYMRENRPSSSIQRFIRPEEIGQFVTFVASPMAGAFSGEALRMDGGMVPTIF